MKMRKDESFIDFELKCEKQIKYCNFTKEQAEEELAEALIRRSVPEISKQLRLLAPTLQSDLFAIIKQGTHLDHMRKEDEENKDINESQYVRPVMNLQQERNRSFQSDRFNRRNQRYNPYQRKFSNERQNRSFGERKFNVPKRDPCAKCAEFHGFNSCPAQNRKCMNCHRWGHYSKCCKSPFPKQQNTKEEVKHINQVKIESEKFENINSDEEED